MGPAEGFRSRETLAFALSMIAAAILVTLLAYYNTQVFSYASTDDSLERLARSIDSNFRQEVMEALQTPQRVSENAEVKDELKEVMARKQKDKFQAYSAVLG